MVLLPLPPNECPNVGGVRGLRVWPASNVRLPAYQGVSLLDPLVVLDPDNYADIWFLPDSAGFSEPQDDSVQGDLYKPVIQLVVPKDAPDIGEAVARLTAVRYLVAGYTDGNGLSKLVGTPENPLRFSSVLETGKRGPDRNGYAFMLAGETPRRAPFFLAPSLGAIPTRRAFSPGFSFGFH
ncbi:hypothetical protein GO988_16015 [Hymenobacter sp. HMF4947]|uniref:Uncharacterized protein n=1 Tax=Hymenobacter ginkgonis TaxID=2682976 RepID=A0A7K1THF0_9BACT|nr:hypothetical protein [Hymenobacter ginkgonis]MVN77838.1 hypothetical protein [Hymenobacter ginkgonis]